MSASPLPIDESAVEAPSDSRWRESWMGDKPAPLPSAMAKIICWPDERLAQKSRPVPIDDAETMRLVRQIAFALRAAMVDARGVGLSAVQIGVPIRLFVVHVPHETNAPLVFVNPIIREYVGKPVEGPEGCLSLPGELESVARAPRVIVARYTEMGARDFAEFGGLTARAIQHEYEHLEGMTLLDKITNPARRHDIERRLKRRADKRARRARQWQENHR